MSSDFGVNDFLSEGMKRDGAARVSDILARGVRINWDEAVALWLEVLQDRGDAPIPAFESILIDGEGEVVVDAARSGERGPVAAGRALHGLLATADVPVALRLFVTQSHSPDTHASVAAFAQGLAYFARPGRAESIRTIYERYRSSSSVPSAVATPIVPPLPASVTAEPPAPERTTTMRSLLPAALLIGVVGLSALIWFGGLAPGRGDATARVIQPKGSTATGVDGESQPALAGQKVLAEAQVDPPRRPSSPARSPRHSMTTRPGQDPDRTSSGTSKRVATLLSGSRVLPSVPLTTPLEATVAEPTPAIASNPPETATTIYSGSDVDVQPPVMQQSALPPPVLIGTAADSLVNRMELLIAADGSVERVRLLNLPTRMPDMMLLSGAKLWRFTPALKDGVPVRYRTTVTWTGFP